MDADDDISREYVEEGATAAAEIEAAAMTASRNGSMFSVFLHLLCSGLGFQALLLPVALANLGWVFGILVLSLVFLWHFYTRWLLVHLHEFPPGTHYTTYLQLATQAFGPKLGRFLGVFPVMYLSGGTCVLLIIIGGNALKQFFNIICGDSSVSGVEYFLVFTFLSITLSQLQNFNSIVSLVGSIAGVAYYYTIVTIWIVSNRKDSVSLVSTRSGWEKAVDVISAIGIIQLSFRGHNLVLEIQGTLSGTTKHPTKETMWKAVRLSYLTIAVCFYPVAICGLGAYGNKIPNGGGMLIAFADPTNTSKFLLCLVYILLVINSICTFQLYAIPVFDNLEHRYTLINKHTCSRLARTSLRVLFGCFAYFISMAFPFLPSLGALIGGLTCPLTFVYPCFMWVFIKKPRKGGGMWLLNLCLGCFGYVVCVLTVAAAIVNLIENGLKANFFKP